MTDEEYNTKLLDLQNRANLLLPQEGEEISDELFKDRESKIKSLKQEIEDCIDELHVEDFLKNGAGRSRDVEYR